MFQGNFGRLDRFRGLYRLILKFSYPEGSVHREAILSLANFRGRFFFTAKFSGDHFFKPIIAKSWEQNVKNLLPKIAGKFIEKLRISQMNGQMEHAQLSRN